MKLFSLLLAVSSVATVSVKSQQVPCRDCLVVTPVVRLEIDRASSGIVADAFTEIIRTSKGEYLVGPVNTGRSLALFSPDGQFVRAIGRFGGGPGEFASITRIFKGSEDSILVYDAGSRRLAVLSPTLAYVRSVRFADHRAVVQVGNFFVGLGTVQSRDQFGNALHVYTARNGALYRSFYGRDGNATVDSIRVPNGLAADTRGRLWAYDAKSGSLSIADTEGTVQKTFVYRPLWHNLPVESVPRTEGTPRRGELQAVRGSPRRPFTGVNAMEVVDNNLVFIWGGVPRSGWELRQSPFKMTRPESRSTGPSPVDYGELTNRLNGWFETRVDVVDLNANAPRSIGTARLPVGRAIPLGNGYVAGFGAHEDGSLFADVWYVRISAPKEHKLPNACSGGNALGPLATLTRSFLAANYRFPNRVEEEVAGGCGACGGTSTCHYYFESGPCHVACSGGGGESLFQQTAAVVGRGQNTLIRLGEQASATLEFNVTRSVLQVVECDGTVVGQVPITDPSQRALLAQRQLAQDRMATAIRRSGA